MLASVNGPSERPEIPTWYHLAQGRDCCCSSVVVGNASRNGTGSHRAAITVRATAHDDPIERAVSEIRYLARKAALDLALEIGEIVFRRVFDSDMTLVRLHGPKHASFRSLALHPELPVSATSLWRAVATFELFQRAPHLRRSSFLCATHVHAVLSLPPNDQERLLERAEREGWAPNRLREQAAKQRRGAGGRPRKLEILKALDALRRVAALPVQTFRDEKALRRMTAEEVEAAMATLDELEERLRALRQALDAGFAAD